MAESPAEGPIVELIHDILVRIAEMVEASDLGNFRLANKSFRAAAGDAAVNLCPKKSIGGAELLAVARAFCGATNLDLSECQSLTNEILAGLATLLPSLTDLDCYGCEWMEASGVVHLMMIPKLEYLNLINCPTLSRFPEDGLSNLSGLQELHLGGCSTFAELPDAISSLISLQVLYMSDFPALGGLPDGLSALSTLQRFSVTNCASFLALPDGIRGLVGLEHLTVRECARFTIVPDGVSCLTALSRLILNNNVSLASLPPGVGRLGSLVSLCLFKCRSFSALPEHTMLGLTSLLRLYLCGLNAIPEVVFQLRTLQKLSLGDSETLTSLPDSISSLTDLRILDLDGCSSFTGLPEGISALSRLQELDLSSCSALEVLPNGLSGLSSLSELNLSSCSALTSLPEAVSGLASLQILNVSFCTILAALPEGVSLLHSLKRWNMYWCPVSPTVPLVLFWLCVGHNRNIQFCLALDFCRSLRMKSLVNMDSVAAVLSLYCFPTLTSHAFCSTCAWLVSHLLLGGF